MEGLSGFLYEKSGDERTLVYDLVGTTEETLEMLGLALLVYALLRLLEHQRKESENRA